MKKLVRILALGVTCAALAVVMTSTPASANHEVLTLTFSGSASASGTLDFKCVARSTGASCADPALWSATGVAYSNGDGPTAVRDAALTALNALSLANFTFAASGTDKITISSIQTGYQDLCVDGTEVWGDGGAAVYSENSVSIALAGTEVPGASPFALALVALAMVTLAVYVLRRRSAAIA